MVSAALLSANVALTAQTTSPQAAVQAAAPPPAQAAPQVQPPDYFFPDAPPDATTYNNTRFSIRFGFAVLADYTFIGQNSPSIAQVGLQESSPDLRAGRLVLSGQLKFKRPWIYLIAGDFNEFREQDDRLFEGLDFALTIPLWKEARIVIGKQKEPFVYEMIGDAANLPQQERILSPFFTSRNDGFRYLDNYLKGRMTFSIGSYNDWYRTGLSHGDSGTQVSSRLTALPVMSTDTRTFLHLGVAARYVGADSGELRYRGRPESNVTDNYVDTGKFPAKYARQLAFEALYNIGSFSVLAESAHAWVESPDMNNPRFRGSYVTGSYVLTGEHRPYDKTVGYARRIIPRSRWGAVELVGRFGYVDLDDALVKGGTFAKWYAGANWWASRQWKFGVGYGLADLDLLDTTGRTQMLHARLQWIY